jgi:hypothetical protein
MVFLEDSSFLTIFVILLILIKIAENSKNLLKFYSDFLLSIKLLIPLH